MEVEEMKRKEPQAEIPWIPTTPVKPVVPKSAPICTPVEGNSQIYHQANGAFACSEFPHGTEKNRESHDGSVPAATITDIAGENGKICDKTASDNVSCWSGLGSSEFVFRTEVASSSATRIGDNNGLNDLVVPSVVSENSRDPHETSDIACCSKRTSQDDPAKKLDKDGTPPDKELCDPVVEFAAVSSALMENHNPDEGSSLCTGLNKTPEKKPRRKKHRPKVIREGKPKRTPKPATPKPAPSKENTTGKRKYVRRKELKKTSTPAEVTGEIAEETPEAAKMSCQRSLNFDTGTKDESSAGRENITALLGKENGVAAQETNFGLICDLNTSVNVKHASNSSMSLPEETHETKPKENPTGKRKYIRRKLNKTSAPPAEVTGELTTEKMPELAKPPCKSCTNFDKGGMEESSAVKETATAHLSEENVVTEGTNPDLAYDVKTPMKQASDSNVSLTEDTQTINKSSRRKKLKEGPITKRQYERRSKLNKSSTPTTEVSGDLPGKTMPESAKTSCQKSLNFDRGARDESSADKENATVHPCKETGAAIQEIGVGFGYDMESFMKQAGENNYLSFCNDKQTPTVRPCEETGAVVQEIDVCLDYDMETFMKPAAENNYMSFCNNEQTTSTSPSKTNPPGEKPKQNLTGNKYQRRKRLNKSPTCQTEMTGEDTGAMMPESKATPMKRFSDVDMGVKDESSAHKEIVNVQMGDLVEETPVSLAYNQDTWIKQALNSYMSGDAQAPSTDPSKDNPPGEKPEENPNGKRKCVKKKRSKRTSTQREMTDELTEPIMSEPTVISCRMSINFDNGGRDESNMCNESLASDQNTLVKEMSNSHMSLSENTQAPSACLPKSNPPGAKRNPSNKNKRKGLPTAEDGNISNGQVSTIESQMVGCEREHSGTTELADNNNMNLIGAHYNGLHSYQSKFPLQFPNIQKKKRTEKEKTNTCITSSVIAENGVPLMFSPQYAQVHPYASNYNSWMYGSGYNTAVIPMINECTENYIHNTQTFDEFRLSLRRVTERSQFEAQTSDYNSHYNSLMRIRSCVEPDYTAKQLEFSDRQTIRDAERPQTCIDVLVEDMPVSCAKKKQNKKRSVISSSAHPNTDEMQQCHNFALVNHNLAQGKSSDTARRRKKARDVEALTAQFRRLNINTGEKDLVLYKQNALVPFQGSFDPIKKQRPRPKVDLDEETDRVWKLLLLDINHEGVDGTDEDKAKWWENERNVFRGRAESFIARMHLVQGDRRFSRWKGSVVDSVVGVFLTQNVSDHLSSSAFMSLAARFPLKSSSNFDTCHEESASMIVNTPEVQIVEPEENAKLEDIILNQSVHELSSMTKDIIEHSEERETVDSNSIDSCGTTGSLNSLKDESNCKLSEPAQSNIREHGTMEFVNPTTGEGHENSCRGGVRKELNALFSSHCSIVTSQLSGGFSIDQNPEKIGSFSDSNAEVEDQLSTAEYNFSNSTSFSKLLGMASSTQVHEVNSQRSNPTESLRDSYGQSAAMRHDNLEQNMEKSNVTQSSLEAIVAQCNDYSLKMTPNSGVLELNCYNPVNFEASSSGSSMNNISSSSPTESHSMLSQVHLQQQSDHKQHKAFHISGQSQDLMQKSREPDSGDHNYAMTNENSKLDSAPVKSKGKERVKEKKDNFNWDSLRIQAQAKAGKREKTESTMDSLDWDAVRRANVNEIADAIKERGMNNMLAERIQSFLNLLVEKHGAIDLEWLRDVPPDQAKEFLLSIRGLGLKSVECVRLLTLHHLAFPVDTNVGRIAVRLGWVPLQPLPESLQLHLLELYPVLESIQKYLWPRLCKLDQKTLYELHYQLITFGKVFCTKSKPNCNACPMRGECRHFASAFASARLALPGPEQKNIVISGGNNATDQNPSVIINQLPLPLPGPEQKNIDITTGNNVADQNQSVIINQLPFSITENTNQAEEHHQTVMIRQLGTNSEIDICQPIIEEPATPEPECSEVFENDIEDAFYMDSDEIPTIKLDIEEFTTNLQNYMQENMELQEGEVSKALVALNQEAAYIPTPKLKNVSRLRTEHSVYELPDTHRLLEGWEKREPDDPGKYLLAIWTPGETANSIQPPEGKCSAQERGQLCNEEECFSCNSFREANSQIVRGTILIPCRTAMRGSFPLNGTYFQVNEVFADHESSLNPISVPRSWIWNLNRRTVHFGTSIPTIFKGLTTPEIQQCFWRGFVCVRGFDRQTRAPRPLKARLHFPASKLAKTKEKPKNNSTAANSQGLNSKQNADQPEFLASIPNLRQNGGS